MAKTTTQTVEAPTFGRSAVPSKRGGAGRKPNIITTAFLAASLEAPRSNAVVWTPNVKGLGTKAANLRTMAKAISADLRVEQRGDSLYGYNVSL